MLWHCQTSRINPTLCCLYWYKRPLFLYGLDSLFSWHFALFCLWLFGFCPFGDFVDVLWIVPQRQTYLQRLLSMYVFLCVPWFPSLPFVRLKSSGSLPQASPELHEPLPWLLDFLKGPYTEASTKKTKIHIFDYRAVSVHIRAGWRNVNFFRKGLYLRIYSILFLNWIITH